ncbi:MAG: hypothetical protein M3362_14950 [Acidobacteriota bacterium]|nr:hypothetical protein [Acidobacteriota bacterium]
MRWLTDRFQITAITFGRRILVTPKVIIRDEENRLRVSASLIAHEATHVIQYCKQGFMGFLASYVAEYLRALLEQKQGWAKAARAAAYFKIKQEREAYEAQAAYPIWKSKAGGGSKRGRGKG